MTSLSDPATPVPVHASWTDPAPKPTPKPKTTARQPGPPAAGLPEDARAFDIAVLLDRKRRDVDFRVALADPLLAEHGEATDALARDRGWERAVRELHRDERYAGALADLLAEWKLDRLKGAFLDGDLDKREYQTRKAALADHLAALPSGDVGRRLAVYLADTASAWRAATPGERNRLARHLFAEAVVENRTVVAVKPRPDLLPFFATVKWCEGGSDGDRFSGCILPVGALLFAETPPRRCVGPSRRDTYREPRRRKLSQEQGAAIRASAGIRTLRELAADFGVSHETVRAALRCRVQ